MHVITSGLQFPILVLCAVLGLLPNNAWADHFEQIVGIQCKPAEQRLLIEHHGAYNKNGDRLVQNLASGQWDLGRLKTTATGNGHIAQTCRLGNTTYDVIIFATSWGNDGVDETAHVRISEGKKVLFDRDLQASTFSDGPRPAITRILVTGGSATLQISATEAEPY